MAPAAVTKRHKRANSRNCQCWTHGLENLAFLSNTKGTEVVCILLVTNQHYEYQAWKLPTMKMLLHQQELAATQTMNFGTHLVGVLRTESGAHAITVMQWYLSESYKPRPQNPLIYW
jgi:hypothetical protein